MLPLQLVMITHTSCLTQSLSKLMNRLIITFVLLFTLSRCKQEKDGKPGDNLHKSDNERNDTTKDKNTKKINTQDKNEYEPSLDEETTDTKSKKSEKEEKADFSFGTPIVTKPGKGTTVTFTPTKDKKKLSFDQFVDGLENSIKENSSVAINFIRNIGKLADKYGMNHKGFEFRAPNNAQFNIQLISREVLFHNDPLNGPLSKKLNVTETLRKKIKNPKYHDAKGLNAAFDSTSNTSMLIWTTTPYGSAYELSHKGSDQEILAWMKRIVEEIRFMQKNNIKISNLAIHTGSSYAQTVDWVHFRLEK